MIYRIVWPDQGYISCFDVVAVRRFLGVAVEVSQTRYLAWSPNAYSYDFGCQIQVFFYCHDRFIELSHLFLG